MDKTLYSLQTTNSFERYENVCDLNGIPNILLLINSMKIVPEISLRLRLDSISGDQTWNLGSSLETSATLNTSFPAEIVYSPSILTYQSFNPLSFPEITVTVKESSVYKETSHVFNLSTIDWILVEPVVGLTREQLQLLGI